MKLKLFYIVVFFQIACFHSWSQSIDDILQKGEPKSKEGEVTLTIDTDIHQGKTPEEQEKAKQDSIKQVNEKWKGILSGKNNAIRQLLDSIQQIDASNLTKERIEEYRLQVNNLKRPVDTKIQNNGSWKNNDELDDMYNLFLNNCDVALLKLKQWEEKIQGSEGIKINWLIVLGVCFAAFMIAFPIIMQLKAKGAMKKIEKQQALEAKKRADEEERQRLLANEDDIITLK